MLSDYCYEKGGTWVETGAGWPLSDFEGLVENHLREGGWERMHTYGAEYMSSIEVWQKDEQPYIVFWSMSDHYRTIYAQDVPSLVELLSLLAPIATADLLGEIHHHLGAVEVVARRHPDYVRYRREMDAAREDLDRKREKPAARRDA